MTGNEYQKLAMRTAGSSKEGYLENAALGLCGESGEVADIVKKHKFQGHELDREHIAKELGDVMWYVALMAEAIEYNLDDIMEGNIEKLKLRYPDGFEVERSVNRVEGDI